MSMYSLIPNSTVNEIDTTIDANVFFDSSSIVKEIIEFEEVRQLHPIPCNWYQSMNCILFHVIDTIVSFYFKLNKRDNVIPDQLLLQLMKSMNCILFHVIDTICSFKTQLHSTR